MKRPTRKHLDRVFAWLEENGFEVISDNVDPATGNFQGGCRSFTVDEVIKLHETKLRHARNGTTPVNLMEDDE